ncbi:MAG: DUF4292 domain-containing protein [Chitinophagales bacterium]
MSKRAFFALLLAGIFASCSTTRSVTGGKIMPMDAAGVDSMLRAHAFSYETFKGKAKLAITIDGSTQNASAVIDMRKDSLIGISIRVLGVEGARVQITPDSVLILDRLHQEYLPRAYSFIEEQFSLRISFSDLQNLIAGNAIFYDDAVISTGESDENYILYARSAVYKNTVSLSPGFDILRMFIEDLEQQRTLTLTYDNFDKINEQQFAFLRSVQIKAKGELAADIEFNNVTINEPFDFSFNVNPKYIRVD